MKALDQQPLLSFLMPCLRHGETVFNPQGQITHALPTGRHIRVEMLGTGQTTPIRLNGRGDLAAGWRFQA